MKPVKNWENVQAPTSFESLPAGAYVCEIKSASEKKNKNSAGTHIEIMFDVCEGEHAGYFMADYKGNTREDKFWRGVINQNVPDENSSKYDVQASFFKRFTNYIEDSNPGYHWDWNEKGLAGKKMGVIFAEREKQSQRGTIYNVTYADSIITVEDVYKSNYTIPALKKLNPSGTANSTDWVAQLESLTDSDLPF